MAFGRSWLPLPTSGMPRQLCCQGRQVPAEQASGQLALLRNLSVERRAWHVAGRDDIHSSAKHVRCHDCSSLKRCGQTDLPKLPAQRDHRLLRNRFRRLDGQPRQNTAVHLYGCGDEAAWVGVFAFRIFFASLASEAAHLHDISGLFLNFEPAAQRAADAEIMCDFGQGIDSKLSAERRRRQARPRENSPKGQVAA